MCSLNFSAPILIIRKKLLLMKKLPLNLIMIKQQGLNIHLVPIFVDFIQFGPYFHFMFN